MHPDLFCKASKAKISKLRMNFTANSFILGCTNRGIAPTTFSANLAGKDLPEYV